MTRTTKIQTRAQFRLDLSAIHLRSPTAALVKALEGLEQGESVHLQQVDDEVRSFGLFPSHLPVVGLKEFRQTLRRAGTPPMMKVSTMWRTSCCARLRIMRAVRSCTKKSCLGCELPLSGAVVCFSS